MNVSTLHRFRSLAFGLTATLACIGAQAQPRADYRCDASGTGFRVVFTGDTARMRLPGGETQVLRQVRMGSGFAYEGGGYRLAGKGDRATLLKAPARVPDECRASRTRP